MAAGGVCGVGGMGAPGSVASEAGPQVSYGFFHCAYLALARCNDFCALSKRAASSGFVVSMWALTHAALFAHCLF